MLVPLPGTEVKPNQTVGAAEGAEHFAPGLHVPMQQLWSDHGLDWLHAHTHTPTHLYTLTHSYINTRT